MTSIRRRRLARQRRRELAQRLGRRIGVGPLPAEKRLDRALDVAAADVPLIQDLQRRLARAMPGILPRRASRLGRRPGELRHDRGHLDGRGRGLMPLV